MGGFCVFGRLCPSLGSIGTGRWRPYQRPRESSTAWSVECEMARQCQPSQLIFQNEVLKQRSKMEVNTETQDLVPVIARFIVRIRRELILGNTSQVSRGRNSETDSSLRLDSKWHVRGGSKTVQHDSEWHVRSDRETGQQQHDRATVWVQQSRTRSSLPSVTRN